jgi:tetratricopeptide (TPR) repeat protein
MEHDMGLALRGFAAAVILALAAGAAQAMDSTSLSEPSSSELYKRAQKSIDAQRYREAIEDLQKVIKDKPKNADAHNLLGYSNRKLGEYDLAVRYYTRALEIDSKHRGANEYLGEAYLELNKLPEAEARLAKLNEICGADCKEYKALAAAIDQYKAGKRPPQSSRASW